MYNRGNSHHAKRPYGGGGRGRNPPPQRGFNNAQQPTEVQVLTNQNRLLPLNTPDGSDYIQYKVTIKNAFYKRIKDETTGEFVKDEKTGEEKRVFETREITDTDMEKFAKKPFPWRIVNKLAAQEPTIHIAYDGDSKAYSPSAASGPEEGKEYHVKVKRDCEEDDANADM